MLIELKKGRDGPASLACVRPDGTRTWSNEHPFFPVHDLSHCAVESVFGFTERIVGLLDMERGTGQALSALEFNTTLAAVLERHGLPPFRPVTDAELSGVRALRNALTARWYELAPGATLTVPFPAQTEEVLS